VPDLAVPDLAVPDLAVPDLAVPDLAVPDLAVPDRRRAGRHARRSSGHHGAPGQHARASLTAVAFG